MLENPWHSLFFKAIRSYLASLSTLKTLIRGLIDVKSCSNTSRRNVPNINSRIAELDMLKSLIHGLLDVKSRPVALGMLTETPSYEIARWRCYCIPFLRSNPRSYGLTCYTYDSYRDYKVLAGRQR